MPAENKTGFNPRKNLSADVSLSKRFSINLKRLREAHALSKSDLARALFGTETDARGYTVARGRDRIGKWESEGATPTPENLVRVSEFFGLDLADLAPDQAGRIASRAPETVSMRILESRPHQAHLKLDMVLPVHVAAQVVALVAGTEGAEDGPTS